MNKIIFSAVLAVIVSISVMYLQQYDGTIIIDVINYRIYTSIFFFVLALMLLLLLICLLVRTTSYIIGIPSIVVNTLYKPKFKSESHKLLYCFAMFLTEKQHLANKVTKQIRYSEHSDIALYMHLLLSRLTSNSEQKIYHLRQLIYHNDYKLFAAKNTARALIEKKDYQQALDYLNIACKVTEDDAELIEMLIDCYAQLQLWNKIKSAVDKLEIANSARLAQITTKIADYYIKAAEKQCAIEDYQSAIVYLKEAIWHNSTSMEATRLICKVNIELHLQHQNIQVITNALKIKPTPELVVLYIKFAEQDHRSIYNNLHAMLIERHREDLLIIAATILNIDVDLQQLATYYCDRVQLSK